MSKRFFKSVLSCMLALIMLVSFAAIPSSAAVSLSKTSVTITKGYATTLSVKGTSNSVTWSSADPTIAKVSSAGKVSGKKIGTTYVYAKVSGTTLKCKVTVVAGKITVNKSSVSMNVGEKTVVTVKATGTHAISVGSTNKSVVKASWGSAKFDGDSIKLTLTATGAGSARVKIYASKYSNVYKYIDVDVDDDSLIDDDTPGGNGGSANPANPTGQPIILQNTALNINAGETGTNYAISSYPIDVVSSNSQVATASLTTASNGLSTITVNGISAGTATIRVYLKSNTQTYADMRVTVTAPTVSYYSVLDREPSKIAGTDNVIKLDLNGTMKYMLVPYDANFACGYDVAKINDAVALYGKSYQYYTAYTNAPNKKQSTDTVYPLNMLLPASYQYATRYFLIPRDYDEPQLNTAIANYTGEYDYYTIYNANPVKKYSTDQIRKWTVAVFNTNTNKYDTITRYLLLPFNYDEKRADEIEANDKGQYQTVQEYVVLTSYPTQYDRTKYELLVWNDKKTNAARYMLVPKTNCDFVKRNDAILASTGEYCYYNAYSTKPKVGTNVDVWEAIIPVNGKSITVYVIVNPADKEKGDQEKFYIAAINGGSYNWTPVA